MKRFDFVWQEKVVFLLEINVDQGVGITRGGFFAVGHEGWSNGLVIDLCFGTKQRSIMQKERVMDNGSGQCL